MASAARDLHEEQGEYRRLLVECRRLDSLLDGVLRDPVGVVKIDVEGLEPQVMRGARGLIRRDRPALVFEYWPEVAGRLGWQLEEVAQTISDAGGAYHFEAYLHGQPTEYPPTENLGVYNIVATPAVKQTEAESAAPVKHGGDVASQQATC
jgi:hypothetical protein